MVADTWHTARGGEVEIDARNIHLGGTSFDDPESRISSVNASGTGMGGDVIVRAAENINITVRGAIISNSLGDGDAGSVLVTARNLNISGGGAGIDTAAAEGLGNDGDLEVRIESALTVREGGFISAETFYFHEWRCGRGREQRECASDGCGASYHW